MISSVDQLGGNCGCNLGVVGLHRLQYDGGGDDGDYGGVVVDGYGRAPQAAVMIMMMTLLVMIYEPWEGVPELGGSLSRLHTSQPEEKSKQSTHSVIHNLTLYV